MLKKFDKKDYLLLKALVKDGTQNSVDLSKKTGISSKTIRNRLQKLQKEGVFKKTILIDPGFFQYNIKLDFFIKIEANDIDEFIKKIMEKFKFNILYIGTHWGSDDISMQCVFKKSKDIQMFRNLIKKYKIAKIIRMQMVPLVFKDTTNWLPKPKNFKMSEEDIDKFNKEDPLEFYQSQTDILNEDKENYQK